MSPCQPDVQVKKTHIIVDIQPPVGRTRNRTSPEKEAKLDDFVAVLAKSMSLFLLSAGLKS